MGTEIKTIKGSYHRQIDTTFKVAHEKAELSITRFYNGKKRGANIQLTITQETTSYIHLTEIQCKKLAQVLLDCFDYKKYPSD